MARFRRTTQHKQKFARIMREYPTHAERRLWESLRATEWGNEVLRQQRILGWIADLHFARQGLVVEIDGPYHETRLLTDLHRDQIMESRGLRVLRIPSEMVAHNEPDILAQIHLALALETMPELPLGAKLWQHFRDRARRDLTSIHRLNQRMYIARHLWHGPALHLQWLSEAGFRTCAELEFTLPEHSELWLTGWDFIRLSHELRNDSPDLLFFYKGEVIAGLLLLPVQELKRFLEEQCSAWADYPYPCLIAPVNEHLYRSERPWHYGNPLPVLRTVLGTLTDPQKRLCKPANPYAPYTTPSPKPPPSSPQPHPFQILDISELSPSSELFTSSEPAESSTSSEPAESSTSSELSTPSKPPASSESAEPESSEPAESVESSASSEPPVSSDSSQADGAFQRSIPIESTDDGGDPSSNHRATQIALDVDGWPMDLHAFRVVDLYFFGGERVREIFWVVSDPEQTGAALLLSQSNRAVLAKAPPPHEEAIAQLSEIFRQHLLALQTQKILVDTPMRWQKLTPYQRRHLQKILSHGHFPPRYFWSESTKTWELPRYARNLRWGEKEEPEPTL